VNNQKGLYLGVGQNIETRIYVDTSSCDMYDTVAPNIANFIKTCRRSNWIAVASHRISHKKSQGTACTLSPERQYNYDFSAPPLA